MSRISLPARSVLLTAAILIALVLAWQLGARDARRQFQQPGAPSLGAASVSVQDELAQLTRERDIALASERLLATRLSEETRLAADERAELELYRRISASSTPVGLGVDSVRHTKNAEGEGAHLDVTLVQSRGRERVRGTVQIAVLRGGEVLADLQQDADGAALEFDLRFFETVTVPLDLAEIGEPDTLRISVEPDSEDHDAFTEELPWNRIAE